MARDYVHVGYSALWHAQAAARAVHSNTAVRNEGETCLPEVHIVAGKSVPTEPVAATTALTAGAITEADPARSNEDAAAFLLAQGETAHCSSFTPPADGVLRGQ